MFGGFDPKKMQAVMKQLGIKQEEIEAERVIIEKSDGSKLVISNPSVTKMTMQGKDNWQVVGEAVEEGAGISEEDVKLVAEKTGKSEEEARKALEEANGDIAEAILKLGN